MKGGRVRRSCFASLHVSPASFPPSSFLRTQRRARSRRRRPVEPPVSPHRTPPRAPKAHPPPLHASNGGHNSGDTGMSPPSCPARRRRERWRREGPGGAGRTGGPSSVRGAVPPMKPPRRTFPVAARKLSPPGKLRGGRGAGGPDLLREGGAAQGGTPRRYRAWEGCSGDRGSGGTVGPVPARRARSLGSFLVFVTGQR